MQKEYLKHFGKLSRAIFLCSQRSIVEAELRTSEKLIFSFLTDGLELYGETFYSFNVHQLQHLIATVENWGPLYESSSFQFESFNGQLKKYIKSSNGVEASEANYRQFLGYGNM